MWAGREKKEERQKRRRERKKKERKKKESKEREENVPPLFHPSSSLLPFISLFSIALLPLSRFRHSSVDDLDLARPLGCKIDEHSRRLSDRGLLARPILKHGPATAI